MDRLQEHGGHRRGTGEQPGGAEEADILQRELLEGREAHRETSLIELDLALVGHQKNGTLTW